MERQQVDSSNIKSIGYDKENRVLEVEFNYKNTVYNFYDVPESVYNGLMNHESHGKYFNAMIKNKYEYSRIN
jgi:hypothetical protein